MNCACKWSEAIEKRLAHVEHRIADAERAASRSNRPDVLIPGQADEIVRLLELCAAKPVAAQLIDEEPQADPAIREVLRASFAAARSAEVRGYAIDSAQFLLSDLHAAGFQIVRTDRAA